MPLLAEVQVQGPAGATTVVARPGDALNLALLVGAPVKVASRVLDQWAVAAEDFAPPQGFAETAADIRAEITLAQDPAFAGIWSAGAAAVLHEALRAALRLGHVVDGPEHVLGAYLRLVSTDPPHSRRHGSRGNRGCASADASVLPYRSSPWLSCGSAPSSRRTDRPRARRLDTLCVAAWLDPLPVDEGVAHAWAARRVGLRDVGKRMPINDSWIAATAIANDVVVASQDGDYDDVPGLRVLRV